MSGELRRIDPASQEGVEHLIETLSRAVDGGLKSVLFIGDVATTAGAIGLVLVFVATEIARKGLKGERFRSWAVVAIERIAEAAELPFQRVDIPSSGARPMSRGGSA